MDSIGYRIVHWSPHFFKQHHHIISRFVGEVLCYGVQLPLAASASVALDPLLHPGRLQHRKMLDSCRS